MTICKSACCYELRRCCGWVVVDAGHPNGTTPPSKRARQGPRWPFTAYGPLFQYFGLSTTQLLDSIQSLCLSGYQLWWKTMVVPYIESWRTTSFAVGLNTPVARIDDEILGSNRMKTFLSGRPRRQDTYSANDGIGLNISYYKQRPLTMQST